MKIRNGFVSNSSSSSFVIYGVMLEVSRLTNDGQFRLDEYLAERALYSNGNTTSLSSYTDYDGLVWLGRSLKSMSDDETLGEFKEKTRIALKEIIAKDDNLPDEVKVVVQDDNNFDIYDEVVSN